jgi:tyrosyl-tRNA synthetase
VLQKDYGQPSQIVLTTPIIEGTDGVQKMSKSYGNYIGINEPPQEIYGKVMSVSDELMWRYYEVLTDISMDEISRMKREEHPMQAKKALARRIVSDFHGAQAATQAGENWARQFQKDEVPEDLETQEIPLQAIIADSDGRNASGPPMVRLDKLMVQAGLAESATDAQRKRKQKAVKIDDQVREEHALKLDSREFILKVGRRMKRIKLS